jgi:hypothetical protein
MKSIMILATLLMSLSAFGYENKEYRCKNANPDLPDNVYNISDSGAHGLPYVEVTRYYMSSDNVRQEVHVRGIASISDVGNSEILGVNQLRLEFIDSELVGCKQP